MAALLITYDLNEPGQKYDSLYETIKALGAWWHYLDSTWIVKCSLTPDQAFEKVRTSLDEGDHILILDVTADKRQGWLPQEAWDWINKNV